MRHFDAATTRKFLPWPALIEALREMFRVGCTMPLRQHHHLEVPGEPAGTLLLMPAWVPGDVLGVKVVGVMPGNAARGLPSVMSNYLLSDARTGELLALIDGAELTSRRTAAASALAASRLARPGATRLLIVGTGQLATRMAAAHAAVRPVSDVEVWGRRAAQAEVVAEGIRRELGIAAVAVTDLASAVARADIVSTVTLSTQPLVQGAWLRPGTHLDLVGAFRPEMRECDDVAVSRATVFVDTREGACREGGDLAQALASGALTHDRIAADLAALSRGSHPGRRDDAEITLFKSVGVALEDLAAARLLWHGASATS